MRLVKAFLIGLLDALLDGGVTRIGCGLQFLFLGLLLIIIPFADEEKSISFWIISGMLLTIGILIIGSKLLEITKNDKS